MSKPKIKRAKPSDRRQITKLKMSSGRVVTDPAEINRLLRREGFTVNDDTGEVGVGPKLRPQ